MGRELRIEIGAGNSEFHTNRPPDQEIPYIDGRPSVRAVTKTVTHDLLITVRCSWLSASPEPPVVRESPPVT